ncbi:mcfH, partial [Symbiodinium pilosum]
MCDQSLPRATAEWIQAQVSTPLTQPTDPIADTSLALIIGFAKQQVRQSSVLADIAFGLVFCGTLTATVIATLQPGRTDDFYQKATLSNITQDMQKPQGRLWSTALGLASVLLVVSMYTFWLYRSWQPWVIAKDNPVASPVMQYSAERRLRIAWALVPNVGFVLAAMVPSMSDVAGYDTVLTAVHNVSAPLSMLFLMIMETVQLGFGENAFHYFFSHEPTPLYGPLTKYQRMRVCLVVEAWISGIIFVGVQGYLAFRKNRRYWVALTSYYGEVIGIILAFSLPVAAALDVQHVTSVVNSPTALAETAAVLPILYKVLTLPLDVARHAMQAALSKKMPSPGLLEALRAASSPPSGLFRGLVPALCCSATGPAAFLLGYEVQRGSKEVLEAGMVAKAVQVAAVQPFDFFRTSWQASLLLKEASAPHLLRGPWEVMTTDGPRSLWRGLIPTLLRDIPAAGTFWWSYMYLSQTLMRESWEEEFDPTAMRQRALQSASISSACAAGAALITQPMDVVKTKMQIHRMLTSRDDGFRRVKVARFFATLRETYQATGLRGLWVGGTPRIASAAFGGLLLGPAFEYAQLLSSDSTRPLRSHLDLGE